MSHLMVWRKIVNEGIASALVMESDADWDMRVKESMLGLSRGAREVADFPFGEAETGMGSPYGDHWDVLW